MKPFYEQEITQDTIYAALGRLKEKVYTKITELDAEFSASEEPVSFTDRLNLNYRRIQPGEKWGGLFDCAWFHFTGRADESCTGKKLALLIDLNGEGCVYDEKGSAVQGLTNGSSAFCPTLDRVGVPVKRVVPLTESSCGDEKIDVWVDAGCNDLFGNLRENGVFKQADLVWVNDKARDLYYDFEVLSDLLTVLDKDSARYSQILLTLGEVDRMLYLYDDRELEKASELLGKQLQKKGADTGLTFYATGHAHLDLGWLWPIRETKRKALRTFSTAVRLLERYPDYIFGASQPQQFRWVKESDPVLYEKLKRKVAEGRIELQGAMWTECDLNLTSGESLVRQILYGQRFWREEFGREATTAHLPDVFGFSGALPQILHKSGVDNLLTIKMSWNTYNVFPYHTFRWQGIDGSQVLVHMPPEGTYNSDLLPYSVASGEKKYIDKGLCDAACILYGIGDGGGGPGPAHLERLKRLKNLSGVSPVVSSTTENFFKHLRERTDDYKTYVGEMYLEKHQGTYTTQARNKRYNRKLEFALRDAEYYASAAWKLAGKPYPKRELDEIWREGLLYQFHDILPGSGIKRVYDESCARYEVLLNELAELIQTAKSGLSVKNTERKYVRSTANGDVLENEYLRAVFGENGEILSLYDKAAARETLAGPSNVLPVYEDNGDAWDMETGYLEKCRGYFRLISKRTYTDGNAAVREQTLAFGKSVFKQTITLKNDLLDIKNEADWHERHKFVKASFRPDIFTEVANCSCAYGNIKRSLKKNNLWENARTEICAHRYIDLSENNYGVSIFSDCKYGYSVNGREIQMSLLRGTEKPGNAGDEGKHVFNYALYPHVGAFENSDACERAYLYSAGSMLDTVSEFIGFSGGAVVESVKASEDGKGIIVRLCEEKGTRAVGELSIGFPHESVSYVTLDEREIGAADKRLNFKPFEIVTLKIV